MRTCVYGKEIKRADMRQNYREHASAKKFLCMRRMSKILRAPCPVILYAACGNDIYFAPAPIVFLSRLRSVACLSHADGIEIYCAPAKLILSRRACTEIFSLPARQTLFFRTRQTQITRSRKCDNVVLIALIRAQQKIRAPDNEILRTYRRNYVKITKLKRHSSSGKASISVRELSVRSQEVRK